MSCPSAADLQAWARGELTGGQFQQIHIHLSECPECRARVEAGFDQLDDASRQTVLERPESNRRGLALGEEKQELAAPLSEGTKLGRYLVLKKLGQGGMGAVYAAYDPELDRKVAIKQLRLSPNSTEAEQAEKRFSREAKAMARLTHPNVAGVFDVIHAEGSVYIAMELVEGATLGAWLAEQPRTQREVLEKFVLAGRGLCAAHAAGIIHRDFKPDNVLVGKNGRVCVIDFGLARGQLEEEPDPEVPEDSGVSSASLAEQLTSVGLVVGTPAFMAPEQWRGKSADARTDQFNFCVSLWTALYDQHPFGSNVQEIKKRVLKGQLLEPAAPTRVPPWLRRALVTGLSKLPEERHESMEVLLSLLEADPSRRRRLWGLSAAAVCAAVFAGVGGLYYVGRHERACNARRAQLEQVWNEGPKRSVLEALSGAGTPKAREIATRVAAVLNAYKQSWLELHSEACAERKQAAVFSRVDTPVFSCLSDRLSQLDRLVKVLSEKDQRLLDAAVGAAYALQPPRACLEAQGDAPRALRGSLRDALVDGRVLQGVGRFAEAKKLVEGVAQKAAAANDRTVLSEAQLLLGRVLQRQEDYAGAERAFLEAVDLATASRHDRIAAQAWTELSLLTAVSKGQYSQALDAARHAQASIERYGKFGEASAQLSTYLGYIYQGLGKPEEALRWQTQAIKLSQQIFGAEHPSVANTLGSMGNTLRELGRFEEALAAQNRALELISKAQSEGHPDFAFAHNALGRTLLAIGRAQEAAGEHQKALEVLSELSNGKGLELVKTLGSLAEAQVAMGDWASAMTQIEQALAIAVEELPREHPVRSALWLSAAEIYLGLGRVKEAVGALENANTDRGAKLRALRFSVGKALYREDREAGRKLVQAAAQTLAGTQPPQQQELEAWLAQNPLEPPTPPKPQKASKRRRR